jgi:hypothetical protein
MAFSTENTSSNQIFTAFLNTDLVDEHFYFIAQKTSDWSSDRFRPAPPEEDNKINVFADVKVFPNPTKDYFTLQGNTEEAYQMSIIDYLGKNYGNFKGNIESINHQLHKMNLASGIYILNISDSKGNHQIIKAIKE